MTLALLVLLVTNIMPASKLDGLLGIVKLCSGHVCNTFDSHGNTRDDTFYEINYKLM